MSDLYLIWSWEHEAWWKPEGWGYTRDVQEAGRFTWDAAAKATVDHVPPGEEVAVFERWAIERGRPPTYAPSEAAR